MSEQRTETAAEMAARWTREREQETHDDGDRIACPVCKESFGDLWDYDWSRDEDKEIECPHCDAPITLSRHVEVSYTCRPRPGKGSDHG